MQMIGSVGFFVAGVAAVTGLSVALYAALPETVLACAERHGRFQGLQGRDKLARGTRAGDPPGARLTHFGPTGAARGFAG